MATVAISTRQPTPLDFPNIDGLSVGTVVKYGPHGRAIFSKDGKHRYWLDRWWGGGTGYAAFCLLNPSVADENILDPTLKRCRGHAMSWGYAGMVITNLFSFRSTDPEGLKHACEPTGGLMNRKAILAAGRLSGELVCGCGAFPMAHGLADEIVHELEVANVKLSCLGHTKNYSPRHPLYLRSTAPRRALQASA